MPGLKMDKISVFKGARANTAHDESTWQDAVDRIRSGKYQGVIERARSITDPAEYSEFKKKLPAITFCGHFPKTRKNAEVSETTGFIIPDIDHLEDVEHVFSLLMQDEYVWFCFRSPSGVGIKCGIRAKNIESDADHKVFYSAVERYFSLVYGVQIDSACKDICRLTFISHDPQAYINPNPYYFDIEEWAEKPVQPDPYIPPPTPDNNGWKERYGRKVLQSSCEAIQNSVLGNKHSTRLSRARTVGGFIASGYINEPEAIHALEQAVIASQAKPLEPALKTVRDGMQNGKQKPLYPQQSDNIDNNYCWDLSVIDGKQSKQGKQGKQIQEISSKVSKFTFEDANGKQEVSKVSRISPQDPPAKTPGTPQNLAAHIKEWITNSTGSFTTEQLDREFCLTTRNEKNNRSKVLNACLEKQLIKKDKKIKGKYHILDLSVEWLDLDADVPENFPIVLPFELQEHVSIPPKALIVIAGSSNAGKTAIILNTLKLNLKQKYEKIYLMSEMGLGEFKTRVKAFNMGLEPWKKIKVASKSYDFDGTIKHYNQNGLTCIDYLEEIDGEYFKITSSIRDIYDSLENGVALVAIQKRSASEIGIGGEGTKEKARLYMTLDFLAQQENAIICALKITKLKEFTGKNLLNHELHFRLTRGAEMQVVMDWTQSSKVDRQQMARQYESGREDLSGQDFVFKTAEGSTVVVKEPDWKKWQEIFDNIDVAWELKKISEDSARKPFLKYKGYFFQLSGILKKTNEDRA